jgi:hypothetical protein
MVAEPRSGYFQPGSPMVEDRAIWKMTMPIIGGEPKKKGRLQLRPDRLMPVLLTWN